MGISNSDSAPKAEKNPHGDRPLIVSVFAGHSGGHLFPALAFAEELRAVRPDTRIDLLTSPKAKPITSKLPPGIFDRIIFLPEFPLPSGISLRTFRFLLEFARAFIISAHYLSEAKPDLCAGFGSYVSYPGIRLASLKKIPVWIHEQNLVPGKASRELARFADCVAVTFENTFSHIQLKRREVVGLPLRKVLRDAAAGMKNETQPKRARLRLLVIGGSQGARGLNERILSAFSCLSPEEKEKLAVIHITGTQDFESVTTKYRELRMEFETFPFCERMEELYGRADAAITRAGANTLFELALFRLPALVIPYPHADGHQAENARYFSSRQAVLSLAENDLNHVTFLQHLRQLQDTATRREALRVHLAEISQPEAAKRLVELTEELIFRDKPCLSSTAI